MTEYKPEMHVYCHLLKSHEEFYIQCERSGIIIAHKTEQIALDFWESGYESAFNRGLQGATGATLTWLACQPSVVYFENQEKMIDALFDKPPYKMSIFMSGSIYGILCQKKAEELWNKGKKPALIKMVDG